MGNATVLEIAWTILALVGMAVCSWACLDALGDWRAARTAIGAPTRRINYQMIQFVALGAVRREATRVVIQALFVAIGVTSMIRPAPIVDAHPLAIVAPIAFVVAATLIVSSSILDRAERVRLWRFER